MLSVLQPSSETETGQRETRERERERERESARARTVWQKRESGQSDKRERTERNSIETTLRQAECERLAAQKPVAASYPDACQRQT
jgi:hypothetical protein